MAAQWPSARARDGGVDRVPLPDGAKGELWLCGKHAVGPDPAAAMARVDATTIVCLNERYELEDRYPEYVEWLKSHGGDDAVWFPIPDLHAPALAAMRPLLDELQRRLRLGERMLVHCGAGIGRAGTVATCLLMLMDVERDDALHIVAAHRPTAGPEVGAQRDLIDELARTLARTLDPGWATMRPVNARATLGWRAELPAVRHALGLLGQPASRWAIPTPALVLDIDAFDRNVALMATRTKADGLGLRPHAKSHKSSTLALRQLEAGAVGVCCAKLGEAEALVAGGVGPVLVTSPLVDPGLVARLNAVATDAEELWLAVDGPEAVELASRAAGASGSPIGIVIDIDVGMGRTGVADAAAAVALARKVTTVDVLYLAGVQGYGGVWQHIVGRDERRRQMEKGLVRLTDAVAAIEAAGHAVVTRTGGGTGTAMLDAEVGVLNDLQAGSYVFMDCEYRDSLGDDLEGRYEPSLFVQSQVISANNKRWVTLDAGLKAFATDAGPPALPAGTGDGTYSFFGDEHGRLSRSADRTYRPGDRVELIPPHCDPTVDRYDVYHLVRDDVLVDVVAIDARGRAQ